MKGETWMEGECLVSDPVDPVEAQIQQSQVVECVKGEISNTGDGIVAETEGSE